MADIEELVGRAPEALTVKRVFGDPYEGGGVTLIPAAAVRGCGCAGDGDGGEDGSGCGGGFGVSARPVGAYQIKDGEVTWVPAADTTRVIIASQIFGLAALLILRSIFKRRRRRT